MEGADVSSGGVATSASAEDEWLWGWDPTPGIVSVWAESDGSAIVWRRIGETGELIREVARFRPWLLLDRIDDLQFLGSDLAPEGTGDARVTYRELAGPGALRFMVTAAHGRTLAKMVLHGAGRRLGRRFYEGLAPGLGARFLDAADAALALLQTHPDLGRPMSATIRAFPIHRFPYRLVYHRESDRLFILAVAHNRRRPAYWAGRDR
jgi:hypothetical protein